MVRMNAVADALLTITNAERHGQPQVLLRPSSKVIIRFLTVMMKHGVHAAIIHMNSCINCHMKNLYSSGAMLRNSDVLDSRRLYRRVRIGGRRPVMQDRREFDRLTKQSVHALLSH